MSVGLFLLLAIPGLCVLLFGTPVHWEMPQLKGFNFVGGWVLIPELLALTIALTVYTAAFIAEKEAKAAAQGTPYSKSEVYKVLLTLQQRDPE